MMTRNAAGLMQTGTVETLGVIEKKTGGEGGFDSWSDKWNL
jgi:hypothetical protein